MALEFLQIIIVMSSIMACAYTLFIFLYYGMSKAWEVDKHFISVFIVSILIIIVGWEWLL